MWEINGIDKILIPLLIYKFLLYTSTLLFKRAIDWQVFCSPVITNKVKQET
jgi:hypothetical protein